MSYDYVIIVVKYTITRYRKKRQKKKKIDIENKVTI